MTTIDAAGMACDESGRTSMSAGSPQDLLDALNELLEAERAGARVTFLTAAHAPESAKVLIHAIHHDEAHWCDVLVRAIRRLQGAPSQTTGAFCAKAMAIEDVPSRLAYLNRGQQWVIRKVRKLLPSVSDVALRADLAAMLACHETNVGRMAAQLTAAASHPAAYSRE